MLVRLAAPLLVLLVLGSGALARAADGPPRLVVHTAGAKTATAIGIRDAAIVLSASVRIGAGYTLTLGQPAGARVGSVTATQPPGTGTHSLTGPVLVATPDVTACDGAPHAAVWTAALSDGTQVVGTLVLAADPAPAQVLVCAAGLQLDELELRLPPAVLRAPQQPARSTFEAQFETTTGEAETSVVTLALPPHLSLQARYDRRRHVITVGGILTEAGAKPAATRRVVVWVGRQAKRLSPLGSTTTRPAGGWNGTITNARQTLYVQARVTVPDTDITAGGCTPPTFTAPCVSATASGYGVVTPVARVLVP